MEYKKTNYFDTGGFEQTTDIQYDNVYADVSPAFQKHFSTYLKKKYKTDEALQAAWQDRSVTIQNPGIPDCEARYFINGVDYDIDHPNARYATSGAPAAPSNGTILAALSTLISTVRYLIFTVRCTLAVRSQ